MTKKEEPKEESVYVGIEDPITVRRALLEASKSLVYLLKQQQSIRELRSVKQRGIETLRALAAQINELIAQAKQVMPEPEGISLPEEKEEKQKKAAKAKAITTQAKKQKAPSAAHAKLESVDKLERELQDIEKKLQQL